MLDPKEFWDILRKHFAEVTPEEFLENVKKYCPQPPEDNSLQSSARATMSPINESEEDELKKHAAKL